MSVKNLISTKYTPTILWKKIDIDRLPSISEVMSLVNSYYSREVEHHCHVREDTGNYHTIYSFVGYVIYNETREDYNFAFSSVEGKNSLLYVNAIFSDVSGVKTYRGSTPLTLIRHLVELCNS